MKILIIGAGAVGQTYGRALQRGGAKVSVYVREKYAAEARSGYVVHWLSWPRGAQTDRFVPDSVITSAAQVARQHWDQLWLCVSSPALRGRWLIELIEAMGKATLVTLQPGLSDRALLLELCPEDRLLTGMIAFIAYSSPLPGETRDPPGVAAWCPWVAPSPFSGPPEAARQVVQTLKRGGCPAKVVGEVRDQAVKGSAVLLTAIAALEATGWSLARFRAERANLATAAAREALAASGSSAATPPAFLLKLASVVGPWVLPLPFEPYLEYHFTKVGDQTRMALEEWIAEGERLGTSTAQLQELRGLLPG